MSLRKNSLTSLFKEVRVFKEREKTASAAVLFGAVWVATCGTSDQLALSSAASNATDSDSSLRVFRDGGGEREMINLLGVKNLQICA